MALRAPLLLVVLVLAAGCGASSRSGVKGTSHVVRTSSELVACQRLRAVGVGASAALGHSWRRFQQAASPQAVMDELRRLQLRFARGYLVAQGVPASSPRLRRDRMRLMAALKSLAQKASIAQEDINRGDWRAAGKTDSSGVLKLHAVTDDLMARCDHLG